MAPANANINKPTRKIQRVSPKKTTVPSKPAPANTKKFSRLSTVKQTTTVAKNNPKMNNKKVEPTKQPPVNKAPPAAAVKTPSSVRKPPRKHSGVPIPEKMRLALLKQAQNGSRWDDSF